jgi:hypothetical protein
MIKNNKEKVFELKIEDDDDISGIDSISLVDEPAIEVNWVSFKKEKPQDFIIPDGEDSKYLNFFNEIGEKEEDLLNDGWEIFKTTIDGKDNFVNATPNEPSLEDTAQYRIRYKYILNPEAPGAPIKATTREFCKDLINKNFVYRVEDLDAIVNDLGSSALVWRGSYNCRHLWQQITYRKEGKIGIKSSDRKGRVDGAESLDVLGYPQPDTRVPEWPSFSKQGFAGQKVSMDYDDTLSTLKGQQLAKRLMNEGKDLYIVTRRLKSDLGPVYRIADQLGISRDKVHATNGKLKWETIKRLGIKKHIDNNPDELKAIQDNLEGVQTEQFGYDVGTIGGYVDPGIGKKKKMSQEFEYLFATDMIKCENCGWQWNMKDAGSEPYVCHKCGYDNSPIYQSNFESHSDYPDSVKNNAKAVLKYVDENGWGSCGTDVGKQRANQLANGEPISEDTIRRMYSYLSRHKVDLDSSKGYGDGCGKLMYDSWGGLSALSWAEAKIKSIDKESMSKQYFASDNEKHIVLGPAMIPDQKIFRKDALGNPYYVFFTPETIKMIAEKYMRNKYTDNNDTMHDGKAIKDIHVMESWIKESNNDKSSDYGFENLPIGTWFVSMKVNNEDVWSQVKEKKLNGFSVSGFFSEVAQFTREEMFLYKVAEILKNIKE